MPPLWEAKVRWGVRITGTTSWSLIDVDNFEQALKVAHEYSNLERKPVEVLQGLIGENMYPTAQVFPQATKEEI